ncbi:MAG: hypothetical protein VCC00_03730 [Deltaproteobacteria bacterium]
MAREGRLARGVWLGPLVAVIGLVTYFTIFYRWPLTRDLPWLNFLVIAAGIALAFSGMRASPGTGWRAGVARLAVGVSLLPAALLAWYSFVFSAQMPATDLAAGPGTELPALILLDDKGDAFHLGMAGEKRALIVFYRGFW